MKCLYEVKNAIYYSDTFGRGYHDFDDDLLKCYKDNFVLGEFESDAEALKALEDIQYKDDQAASALLTKIQKERGYAVTHYGELGEGGVCYEANLWKKVGDEYVRVGEDE